MNEKIYHRFPVDIAEKVGVIPAIVYSQVEYQTAPHRVKDWQKRDGLRWYRTTVDTLAEYYPYLSAARIRNALKKLVEAGILLEENYNRSLFDKARWYAIAPEKHPSNAETCDRLATDLQPTYNREG